MTNLNLLMENVIKDFTEASIIKDVKRTGVLEDQGFLIEFNSSKQVVDLLCVFHLDKEIIYFYNGFIEKAFFLFPTHFNNIKGWVDLYKEEIAKNILFKNTIDKEKQIDLSELLTKPLKKKKKQNKNKNHEEEDLDIRGLADDIEAKYTFIIEDEYQSESLGSIDFSSAKKLNNKSKTKQPKKKEKRIIPENTGNKVIKSQIQKQEAIKEKVIIKEEPKTIVERQEIKPKQVTKNIHVNRRQLEGREVEQIKVILFRIVDNKELNLSTEIPEKLSKYLTEISKFQKLVITMNTDSLDKDKFINTVANNIFKLLNKGARFNG